jgi:hypothetical protein
VAGDNAYANSRTVTITANATCDKISTEAENGATGSGSFTLNAGVTLTANVNAGPTTCVGISYNSPNSATITGNITGGTALNSFGVSMGSTGTLTINGNVAASTISNSASAINISAGTLNIYGTTVKGGNGSSYGIVTSGSPTIYIQANCVGSDVNTTAAAVNIASAANVTIVGNVTGGLSSYAVVIGNFTNSCTVTGTVTGVANHGILFGTSTGTLSVTGNVYGSNTTASIYGINVTGAGTVSVSGNVYGSAGPAASGLYTSGAGIISMTGSVYGSDTAGGGRGCFIASSNATVNVIGSAIAGKQLEGALNNSTGTLKVVRAVGNGHGLGSVGTVPSVGILSNNQSSLTYVEEIQYGSLGQSPTAGPIILTDKTSNVALFYRPSLSQKTLTDPASVSGVVPSAADVRYGTVYNAGSNTGTLRVPAAGSVALGVPVDATTGTAILTSAAIWDTLTSTMSTSGSIGERLKNASTVASTGQQLSDALRYT